VFLATWAPWCGCRSDLPVWQALFDELKSEAFMVVAVAEESGGAERVRPWVEAAGCAHWSLVDCDHRVGGLYGLVNVPQAVWIDEAGRIVRPPENPGWTDDWRHNAGTLLGMPAEQRRAHGFLSPAQRAARDAGRLAYADAVKAWVRTGRHALPAGEARRRLPTVTPEIARAHAHFRFGVWLRRKGRPAESDRHLAEASRLHPASWTLWRQAADLAEPGQAAGPEFLARLQALGDTPYYPAPDLPGFSSSSVRS
jgi:hypothetical protein